MTTPPTTRMGTPGTRRSYEAVPSRRSYIRPICRSGRRNWITRSPSRVFFRVDLPPRIPGDLPLSASGWSAAVKCRLAVRRKRTSGRCCCRRGEDGGWSVGGSAALRPALWWTLGQWTSPLWLGHSLDDLQPCCFCAHMDERGRGTASLSGTRGPRAEGGNGSLTALPTPGCMNVARTRIYAAQSVPPAGFEPDE
jgi:hypothetical protein